MSQAELCIYGNPWAVPKILEQARAINGPGIIHVGSREELQAARFKRIVAVGGETTGGLVCEEVIKRGGEIPVAFWHAGTQGVLRSELCDGNAKKDVVMSIDKFRETPLHEFRRIRLGQMGGTVFINHVGFGIFETNAGKFNEICRSLRMPKKLRLLVARICAGSVALVQNNGSDKMELYSMVSNIGKNKVFPGQDVFGDNMTYGYIEGAASLAIVLLEMSFGITPSETVLPRITSPYDFWASPDSKNAWIDGRTCLNPFKGRRVIVKRTPQSIPVAVIK